MFLQNSLEENFYDIYENFVKKYNPKGFLLAISGGIDSMVMLDLFLKCKIKNFKVAYFDHGIRENTHDDISLIKNICEQNNINYYIGTPELPLTSPDLENKARIARYNFLKSVRKDNEIIVTAHHEDDQIETVLMNFLKGSFVSGLSGLARYDASRNLWRPLLDFSKTSLIEYGKENDVLFIEDYTNKDSIYLRNFLRLDILPLLTDRLGGLSTLSRNAEFYGELAEYLSSDVDVFLKKFNLHDEIQVAEILKKPAFFRYMVYSRLALDYVFSVKDFYELDKLIKTGVTGKYRIVNGVQFLIHKKKLICKKSFS